MSADYNANHNKSEAPNDRLHWQDEKIKAILDFYRGLVLDAVEPEITEIWRWRPLRSRLLKALGDRGLEGKLLELVDSARRTQSP